MLALAYLEHLFIVETSKVWIAVLESVVEIVLSPEVRYVKIELFHLPKCLLIDFNGCSRLPWSLDLSGSFNFYRFFFLPMILG